MTLVVAVPVGLAGALIALAGTRWLRRRAGARSAWLSSRLHVVLAAAGCVGGVALADGWPELMAYATLAVACAGLVVVDLAVSRLPDAILGPTAVLVVGLLLLAAVVGDEWARFGRALATAVGLFIAYYVLAVLRRSGLGFGDVKLAGILGAFLGWLGWSSTLLGFLAGFAAGGICAAVLLLLGRADRHGSIPFGPWMIAGAAVGAAFGPALLGSA